MTTAITPEQAFEKYFGNVVTLSRGGYPFKCKSCDYLYMVGNDYVAHLRDKHHEKIMSQKQIDRIEERRKQKEFEKTMDASDIISAIKGTN